MAKKSETTRKDDRDTFFHVMRLTPRDKKIIQTLSPYDRRRKGKTRLEWFDELVPFVRGLKFSKQPEPVRHSMRLEFPKSLMIALQDKSERTKKSMVELLILAAREYAKAHDIDISEIDENGVDSPKPQSAKKGK